eukprot:sb/3469023/
MDDDSAEVPLHHAIFQLLSLLTKEKRPRIWKFLSEFYQVEVRVGYHLLYYLYSRSQLDLYSEFASFTIAGTLKSCLTEDLRICQEEDGPAPFYKMIPELYQKFPSVTTGNANILHLIVSCIDSQQLHTIICHVMSKRVKIFNVRSISPLLRATLEWETFEQYCVWQLVSAESVPSESDKRVRITLKSGYNNISDNTVHIYILIRAGACRLVLTGEINRNTNTTQKPKTQYFGATRKSMLYL